MSYTLLGLIQMELSYGSFPAWPRGMAARHAFKLNCLVRERAELSQIALGFRWESVQVDDPINTP